MKALNHILLLIVLILITSCKSAFNNFNKQKFTSLSKLEPVHQKENKEYEEAIQFSFSKEKPIENDRDTSTSTSTIDESIQKENDPLDPTYKKLIKEAIEKEVPIIVKRGEQYYLLKKPVYDQIYEGVIGTAKKIDRDERPQKYLEIEADDFTMKLDKGTVFNKNIRSVEMVEVVRSEEKADPLIKENEQIKRERSVEEQDQLASKIKKSYERRIKILHILSLISAAVMIIAAVFALIYALPFLITLIVGAYVTGIVLRLMALVSFKKYKRYIENRDIKVNRRTKIRRNWMLAGIILQALPVVAVVALIVYLIISLF